MLVPDPAPEQGGNRRMVATARRKLPQIMADEAGYSPHPQTCSRNRDQSCSIK